LFYEIFDKKDEGVIRINHLKTGLSRLGINNPDEDDLKLLIRAYSKSKDA